MRAFFTKTLMVIATSIVITAGASVLFSMMKGADPDKGSVFILVMAGIAASYLNFRSEGKCPLDP